MQLHLVGGFLGSGKTTAIMSAARELVAQNHSVGIITNDQGKYLVDTAFFKSSGMPTVEVTGGCFCCNYTDLDQKLGELIELAHPEAIFAESVGSCTDLVATVVRPMLALRSAPPGPTSFSVVVDCRLLRLYLLGQSLPFAEDVLYIFEKQIEEAGLVLINKIDLLSDEKNNELKNLFQKTYPQKVFLLQNSSAVSGASLWLKTISSNGAPLPGTPLEINYRRYGAGEAELAWLDEEWTFPVTGENGREVIKQTLEQIALALRKKAVSIGHLKFLIQDGRQEFKLSLTSLEQPGWLEGLPQLHGPQVKLLINGRVQMQAEQFKSLVQEAMHISEGHPQLGYSAAFNPGQPKPTYRFPANP